MLFRSRNVLIERLESRLKLHNSKESFVAYSPINNPGSNIRQVFTIMNTEGEEGISNVISRLNQIANSLKGWKSTIEEMDHSGMKTARRQVIGVADQLKTYGTGGWEKMAQQLDPQGKYPK